MSTQKIDLMAEIPRSVGQNWRDKEAPVLLSALGMRLHPDARAELRVLKENLSDYVEAHLLDQVRLLTIPGKGLAAAPAAETAELSDQDLIRRFNVTPRERSGGQANPRFYPHVWRAFSLPLSEAQRRFVSFQPNGIPKSTELPSAENAPYGATEVRLEDLPDQPLGIGMPPAPVAEAIRAWAKANHIDVNSLYVPTPPRSGAPPSAPAGENELLGILNLLEPSELARIAVPADIVVTLLKRALAKL
jgi:hypothetical protein